MADAIRRHGFDGLAAADSGVNAGGGLVAFARPTASQALLRGRLDDAGFREAAAAALGHALPAAPDRAHLAGGRAAFRLGPELWLVAEDADAHLGRRLEATAGIRALDMSSARARLRLRGPGVRDLLAVGAAIDLRERAFPSGAFAQTTVGPATALLAARARDVFDVYVARSYCASWRLWLAGAGAEFGLVLGEE